MDYNEKHMKSEYLDRLYSVMGNAPMEPSHEEDIPEDDHMCKKDVDKLKMNTLKCLSHHMCKKVIPCDKDFNRDEFDNDIIDEVERYFKTRGGNLLQYFADTKNSVVDAIKEAFDETMIKSEPIDPESEEFIKAVVDQVDDNQDVEKVLDTIERQIKDSAEKDVKEIIDKISDEEDEIENINNDDPMANPYVQADDMNADNNDTYDNINESIFHHYLIKQYKENVVPNDPEGMLIKPMIETSFHYIRKVLFNEGFLQKG